jgi:flavin-dependent dehydrogenase
MSSSSVRVPRSDPEVLIIGGGPGGSTAAALLAQQKHKVLLLERERFPRFHIGESLLPYNHRLFAELGVLSRLEAAGFIVKRGVQFHTGDGRRFAQFDFRRGHFTREPLAFQVERSAFDHLLLDHARAVGAEVREGWTVARVERRSGGATVTATAPDGALHAFDSPWVIDASGRANLTGTAEGLREFHPRHRKLAIYSHFCGVALDPGERGGDTVIVRLKNAWFWIIPLGPDKASVGCVMEKEDYTRAGRSPEETFHAYVQGHLLLRQRMHKARALRPFELTTDFSYLNRRLADPRVLRVGDAAGFIDPIFSSGVFLAMFSGRLAARVVTRGLATGSLAERESRHYEHHVRAAMRTYWRLVEAFYTQPFIELLFSPSERLHLASAVNAILAGELEGGWRLSWRLRLFFFLVRLQARRPLAPRISFD